MPVKRLRRNSDSVVLVRSKENEAIQFFANLRQAEIKLQEKKESLENEKTRKRRSQLGEGSGLDEEASTSEQTAESRGGENFTTE